MPTYKVINPGFYGGKLYDPEGKRKTLTTDKPFAKKSMPSWLTDMPKESKAVREKREAQEASEAVAAEQKAQQDQEDINNASSEGDGKETSFLGKVVDAVTGSKVETL